MSNKEMPQCHGHTAGPLVPGSLYVMLDLRSPDLSDTTFHWALYLHKVNAPYPTGHKYHIKTLGDGWIADHGPLSSVLKSFLLVCVICVAKDIPSDRWQEVAEVITRHDVDINNGQMTCRIWVMQALGRLQEAGFTLRGDVEGLEEELKRIGNAYRGSAVEGEQPRPVYDALDDPCSQSQSA